MTYQQQIKHPNWQKKRLEVLEANGFKCENCGDKDEQLHVHHPLYRRGAMIWEYTVEELECLCARCHKDAHAIDEKLKKALAICSDKGRVLAYINSMNAHLDDDTLTVDSYEAAEGIADFAAGQLCLWVGDEPLVELLVRRADRDNKKLVKVSEILKWVEGSVQP